MTAQRKTGLPKWAQEEFARLDNTINRQCRQYSNILEQLGKQQEEFQAAIDTIRNLRPDLYDKYNEGYKMTDILAIVNDEIS